MEFLKHPLTQEELRGRITSLEDDPYVTAVIPVDLDELLYNDINEFYALIENRLAGEYGEYLNHVDFRFVGHLDNETVLVQVTADVTDALEE